MDGLRTHLRQLLADRTSPEAEALYLTLAGYIERRVRRTAMSRYADLLGPPEIEEAVGEVLLQLMAGSLAQFRGDTLPELLAFVRSICDRCVGRAARKRIKERNALDEQGQQAVRGWNGDVPSPDQAVRMVPESPLSTTDQEYLVALLHAGSRADYAKQNGVSRAAVTQRVQRIRARIEALPSLDQEAAEAWLRHEARKSAAARR